MKRTYTALLFLLALLGSGLRAQEITFTAVVDRTSVATGDPIKLTLTLTNAPMNSGITPPDMGGLVVVQGPYDQSSFSNVNGRMSSSVARVYVLQATQPGTFTIGAATARIGQGTIKTDPIRITVAKAENSGPSSSMLDQGQKRDANLFCTISLSKSKAYVGEQVVATYTLYSRYSSIESSEYDMPKLDGFWAEEIDLGEPGFNSTATVNGIGYRVAVLKKQVLFPQRSGVLRLAPMTLNFRVNRSFFNNGQAVRITSNSAELTVMDLPPKPADHIGAVGDLKMEVVVANNTVKANEAIDITVKFSGRANLKLVDAPKLAFPSDFETYDPKINDRISVNAGGMSGSREFQYLVIPRHEGDYTIPPLTYSYFDPAKGRYEQLTSEALQFTILQGDGDPAVVQRPSRTDVKVLDQDIRYIRTGDLGLAPKDDHLFGSWAYIAGMGAPVLAFIGFIGWNNKRRRLLGDTQAMRRRGADRVAKQRLKEAASALKADDRTGFYTALGRSLEGYFADRFNLGVAQVNAQTINEKLGHLEGGELAKQYAGLIADCEMARFAPFENKPRQQCYEEASSLIHRIEDQP